MLRQLRFFFLYGAILGLILGTWIAIDKGLGYPSYWKSILSIIVYTFSFSMTVIAATYAMFLIPACLFWILGMKRQMIELYKKFSWFMWAAVAFATFTSWLNTYYHTESKQNQTQVDKNYIEPLN